MYQEPCCIERTLPQLLKEHPLCTWQTNGDVTFDKIVKAISYLAGNSISTTLMLPTIDIQILRVLAWLHSRGWLKSVSILTKKDQSELINAELQNMEDKSAYNHSRVVEDLLVIKGEKNTVVVQGWLGMEIQAAQRMYVSYCGNDETEINSLTNSTFSLIERARHNVKKKKAKEDGGSDL